jgi:hypothetical protein
MVRLVLGLVKGAVIGGGLGYGAYRLGIGGLGWVLYGAICFVVGMFVGRPIWSHLADKESTIWTAILKSLFGFGIGVGIYFLVHKAAHDPSLALGGETHPLTGWPYLFGGALGGVYGGWVEVDDAPPKKAPQASGKAGSGT